MAAAQFLSHLEVGRAPEVREIAGHLDRAAGRGEEMDEDRAVTVRHGRGRSEVPGSLRGSLRGGEPWLVKQLARNPGRLARSGRRLEDGATAIGQGALEFGNRLRDGKRGRPGRDDRQPFFWR